MRWSDEELVRIYCKQDGRCHLCRGKIRFEHYGQQTATGWQVDHSVPRARGGTNHPNNLQPAHSACNNYKRTRSTNEVRREFVVAQLRYEQTRLRLEIVRQRRNEDAAATFALAGAAFGAALDTENRPRGALLGVGAGLFLAALCAA